MGIWPLSRLQWRFRDRPMARLCQTLRCDAEDRHGATPRHCYNKENDNGWPRPHTAERKTRPYSNALGARRQQKKDGEAEEDMAKHHQRRPGIE